MAARAAATDRQWITCSRFQQPFVLESLERVVHSPDRVIAAGSRHEITPDFEAVRIVAEPSNREQRGELEASWYRCWHKFNLVEQIDGPQDLPGGQNQWLTRSRG